MNKNFALIGASGYIAPRHMKAIKETGNNLIAVFDPYDGIGIIDSYFPDANFFTEFERFDRFIDKLHRNGEKKIDFISICSPNYLHDSHIRFSLRSGANVIIEKPVVLNPWNINQLQQIVNETGKKVHNILQLRLHPSIINLKKKISNELINNPDKVYNIDLTYLTSRGKWYFISWKGDISKSGGIATNIGIHFFDMLNWIFGDVIENIIHVKNIDTNSGFLRLKNANVRWFLSVNNKYIPQDKNVEEVTTYRAIKIDEENIDFSNGFTDLHTLSYDRILNGDGFDLNDAYTSVKIVSEIRNIEPIGLKGNFHPFCKKIL